MWIRPSSTLAGSVALIAASVVVTTAAAPATIGKNAHLCQDLDRTYRTNGGGENLRKLNFYLFDAAERGCLDLARQFVDAGASIDARDRFGNTALNIASRMGHRDVMVYLLSEGSDLEKSNLAGSTPLLRAVDSDRRRAAKALLEAGADPNVANLKGVRPLTAAAFNGNDRMVGLLLDHGADPAHADRTGKTAIIYAAGKGFSGIVEQLLEAGVPANATDRHALTPLMWAAGHTNDVPAREALATMALLLSRGAEIDRLDDRGRSALMIAAERSHPEIVRYLIEAGADPKLEDKEGMRALDLAAEPRIRTLLEGS
ncbi:MAG: ankyrin repeat domain-containing protein [Geminicoccaceae bacterium]